MTVLKGVYLTLSNGSITDSSGSINFGNENIITTGDIEANNVTAPTITTTGGSSTLGTIQIVGNTISSTNSAGNIIITPNGTGNVNVNADVFAVQGTEGETASIALQCDESDDAGDEWRFTTNTNQTLSIQSNISGSGVDQITLTPHATVGSSTTAIKGLMTVAGNATFTGRVIVDQGSHLDFTNGAGKIRGVSGNTHCLTGAAVWSVGDGSSDPIFRTRSTTELAVGGGTTTITGAATVGGNLSLTAGALSITADGNNAVTFTESSAGIMTIAAPDDIILDAVSDIILDADGADIRFRDGGTEFGKITNSSSNFLIDVGGEIHLDADGEIIRLYHDGTQVGAFHLNSNDFAIRAMQQDKDIIFKGYDGSSNIAALTLNMSEEGSAYFNSDVRLLDDKVLRLGGSSDLQLYHVADSVNVIRGAPGLTIQTDSTDSVSYTHLTLPTNREV